MWPGAWKRGACRRVSKVSCPREASDRLVAARRRRAARCVSSLSLSPRLPARSLRPKLSARPAPRSPGLSRRLEGSAGLPHTPHSPGYWVSGLDSEELELCSFLARVRSKPAMRKALGAGSKCRLGRQQAQKR